MATQIKSIHYPFAIDRGKRILAEENEYAEHVEQMIIQLLFTNPGERINRPTFGCGLRRMVFAPNSTATANLLQVTIYQALEEWLGSLISAEEVKVDAIDEKLIVGITYILKARQERRYLNLETSL
ncbi:MAG: GPW/gp25 family protein [Saprospiraceae bacterium]|nr:GPW/gp25 family protein [Lewinella sp.]